MKNPKGAVEVSTTISTTSSEWLESCQQHFLKGLQTIEQTNILEDIVVHFKKVMGNHDFFSDHFLCLSY